MLRAAGFAVFVGAAGLLFPAPSPAQQTLGFALGETVSGQGAGGQLSVRIIDDERLFRGSLFGERVAAEIEAASRALEAENDRLLEELTAREAELTELRNEMTVEAFRAAANAFDVQAETVRRNQAEKRQRLVQFEESERRRFFSSTPEILQDVLESLGGQVLIDARAVIIGLPEMDMTDEAIAAIDDAIGDGGPAPFPAALP
jgi:Skp family chaperone for outer membrane proteins